MVEPARRASRAIAWHEVRQRLDQLASEMDETFRISPERTRQILDARARTIGQAPAETGEAAPRIELLTFSLAGETVAIETRFVREIVPLADVTPVPGTPAHIRGVANLRGEVLAVVDLGRFFGLASQGGAAFARIVVLGIEHAELGILATEIREVVALPADAVATLDSATTGIDAASMRGVTADALIVLDGLALLQNPRLFVDHARAPDVTARET